jgi:hypothetical protein
MKPTRIKLENALLSPLTNAQRAHAILHIMLRDGKMFRPLYCELCSSDGQNPRCPIRVQIQAHHPDYARPLIVQWLCRSCHKKWHVANGPGANVSGEIILTVDAIVNDRVKELSSRCDDGL